MSRKVPVAYYMRPSWNNSKNACASKVQAFLFQTALRDFRIPLFRSSGFPNPEAIIIGYPIRLSSILAFVRSFPLVGLLTNDIFHHIKAQTTSTLRLLPSYPPQGHSLRTLRPLPSVAHYGINEVGHPRSTCLKNVSYSLGSSRVILLLWSLG